MRSASLLLLVLTACKGLDPGGDPACAHERPDAGARIADQGYATLRASASSVRARAQRCERDSDCRVPRHVGPTRSCEPASWANASLLDEIGEQFERRCGPPNVVCARCAGWAEGPACRQGLCVE